ncbi:hypothetical protein TNIN_499091 [Trichonephila inaurata madagascariensis]|uniref:Uncharacterized protein n=1 Tax=Trichonephila inaurata madagascariensis TaxID=2747483 RepID=A0A8X6WRQ8_9ARAC|nr:hypothetical protein TNIN_499091 [Trichonephila inaurata madagascariensis]
MSHASNPEQDDAFHRGLLLQHLQHRCQIEQNLKVIQETKCTSLNNEEAAQVGSSSRDASRSVVVSPCLPSKSHSLSLIDAFSKSGGTERNNHHRMMAPPRPTQGCGPLARIMCDEDFV